jgi:hypothetical protein
MPRRRLTIWRSGRQVAEIYRIYMDQMFHLDVAKHPMNNRVRQCREVLHEINQAAENMSDSLVARGRAA